MFSLMKNNFFKGSNMNYGVSSYFYRVEFQQRGAPHIHSLLWLKSIDGEEAPNFWLEDEDDDSIENKNISDAFS